MKDPKYGSYKVWGDGVRVGEGQGVGQGQWEAEEQEKKGGSCRESGKNWRKGGGGREGEGKGKGGKRRGDEIYIIQYRTGRLKYGIEERRWWKRRIDREG